MIGRVDGVYFSISSRSIGRKSRKEPGQPWRRRIGTADGEVKKRVQKFKL